MTQPPSSQQKLDLLAAPIGLFAGATYPLRALIIIQRTPRLWNYLAIPVLVNLVVGISLYLGLILPGIRGINSLTARLDSRVDAAIANLPRWLAIVDHLAPLLGFLLRLLLIGGLLIATGLLLVQFGAILGSPWYGQLSEQLEKLRTGQLPTAEPVNVVTVLRDIWRALMFEVKKLLLAGSMAILLLLLNLIPGVGTVAATVGGIAIAATIVCLDFLDAPLERRRLRFRQKLAMIGRSLPASASFALVCLGLISIPLCNLFAVPICVASGTLFFCDRIWPSLHSRDVS